MTILPTPPTKSPDSESDSIRNETPAQTRARQLAEHAAAERQKLLNRHGPSQNATRATGPNSLTARGAAAEAVAGPTIEVGAYLVDGDARPALPAPEATWQKVGRSIGDSSAHVVRKTDWQRGKIFHPKILRLDVKDARDKVPPPSNWLRDVVADFARMRVVGVDVSVPYFRMVMEVYATKASDARGFVLDSYAAIGRLAKLGRPAGREKESHGRETVRKAVRRVEDSGWLGALNTLYRREEDNKLVRDSNVYFLFGPGDATECQALPPEARAAWREDRTKSRAASLWGMAVNAFGVNVKTRTDRRKGNPAPA